MGGKLRILITGGGTGGHLFPALAVADRFIERCPQSSILFVSTGRAVEARALQARSFEKQTIHCGALKGGGLLGRLKTLLTLPLGFCESVGLILRFRPNLVFGVGGYVTGPVVLAAKLLGVRTCIHEQNSVPGMANRYLGGLVDRVFLSMEGSRKFFKPQKAVMTGNPVRREFVELAGVDNHSRQSDTVFMVLGGSQGAHRLNQLVPAAIGLVAAQLPKQFRVIHQTGNQDLEMVRDGYRRAGVEAEVEPFFDAMAERLNRADLVLCRAGATTLAEVTVMGKAAILIPFPFAADDHQRKNGEDLVKHGAARMFDQKELDEKILAREITELVNNPEIRKTMAARAGELARPRAADAIVDHCLKLIGYKNV